ncbi:hypothetical protein GW932_04140 [archaeon]|nr:hypothetical protein [archaeon]
MFGDDFFGGSIDELFRKLGGDGFVEYSSVGPDGKRQVRRKTKGTVFGKALLDKVMTKRHVYFIFDYSGKEDVSAAVKDELVVNDYGEEVATGGKILEIKSKNKIISEYPLNETIRTKDMEFIFKNGILEVSFRR